MHYLVLLMVDTRIFVDFGDGEDFSGWMPVCIGVSGSLTGCAVFCVVVPPLRMGYHAKHARTHGAHH